MLMSICELKQILSVIDLAPDTSVQWSSDRDLIGEVRTMKGRGTFFYMLFEGALKKVTSSLHTDFRALFYATVLFG